MLLQPLLQLAETEKFLLLDLAGGDLRPHLDDPGDVVHGQLGRALGLDGLQLLLQPDLLAAQLGNAGVAPVQLLRRLLPLRRLRGQGLLLGGDGGQLLLQLHAAVDVRVVEVQVGAGLVDQVDGLVGQIPVGDIPLRQRHRLTQHPVGDGHAVELLVVVGDAPQDLQGVLHIGLVDGHRLETALQSGVLFDMLAVLVEGGGADYLDLAPAEGGLKDIGGVHAALGVAGAHDVVHLVDDKDHVAGLADLLDEALHAAFKLAPELGARHQRRQVKEIDLLIPQLEGHLSGGNALGQTLGNGGFAHARLADEAGIVLLAAVEDLHHPLDLLLAADNGIQLALGSAAAEVDAVVVQIFMLFLALAVLAVTGGIFLLSAVVLGRRRTAEEAVEEREGSRLAALLIVVILLRQLGQVLHLLGAAEGLHHLVVDALQILRRNAHALHHILHLGQAQLRRAFQAKALVDHLVFLVHTRDEHDCHIFLTFTAQCRLHGFPPLKICLG